MPADKVTTQELLEEVTAKTLQLDMCGMVADGIVKLPDLKKGDMGWSSSYELVKALRDRYDDLIGKYPDELKRVSKSEYDPVPAWWR